MWNTRSGISPCFSDCRFKTASFSLKLLVDLGSGLVHQANSSKSESSFAGCRCQAKPRPYDGLPAGLILAGERGHGSTGIEPGNNLSFLFFVQACRSAESLPRVARAAQSRLGTLHQKIAFEFGRDHLHGHPPGRAGQIDTAQSEAVNPNADRSQRIDGAANIHGISTQAIELGNDQNVIRFQSIDQTPEGRSLHGRRTAGNGLGDGPARLNGEASGLHLGDLVFGGLAGGGDAGVEECTAMMASTRPNWMADSYLSLNNVNPVFWAGVSGCLKTIDSYPAAPHPVGFSLKRNKRSPGSQWMLRRVSPAR